jgi:alkylhydroperoxidase family enzyme
MSNIREIPESAATGLLRRLYDEALARAGRIWNIVRVMSLNPRVMQTTMGFYRALMFGPSPLARWRREMLAVVTSKVNGCFY